IDIDGDGAWAHCSECGSNSLGCHALSGPPVVSNDVIDADGALMLAGLRANGGIPAIKRSGLNVALDGRAGATLRRNRKVLSWHGIYSCGWPLSQFFKAARAVGPSSVLPSWSMGAKLVWTVRMSAPSTRGRFSFLRTSLR